MRLNAVRWEEAKSERNKKCSKIQREWNVFWCRQNQGVFRFVWSCCFFYSLNFSCFSFCVNLSPILYHDYTFRLNNCFWTEYCRHTTIDDALYVLLPNLCIRVRSLSRFSALPFSFTWIEEHTIYLRRFRCSCILRELVGFAGSTYACLCVSVWARTHYLCTILPQSRTHACSAHTHTHT